MRIISRAAFAAIVTLAVASPALRAQDTTQAPGVRIGLSYQLGARPGVIVLPIAGPLGDSLRAIIQRDLDYGDRVNVIVADSSGAPVPVPTGLAINYGLYAKFGAAAIVRATVLASGALHVILHDVGAKKIAQRQDFTLPPASDAEAWRMAVHRASDQIEQWITGTQGVSATRIAFIRASRLWVCDADGENAHVLPPPNAYSPAWDPSARHIAFSYFGSGGSDIGILDLATGRTLRLVATPGGLSITPVFSPDGKSLVYAHGYDEGTDLFIANPFDLTAGHQITVGRGTDNVSPAFSPDGGRIAFTSGRLGHPEVYITDVDGTNPELLTPFSFGDQYYRSNPDWSPDGRAIAFQSQIGGIFQVMTIALRDRSVKQLTTEGANEEPAWAPDARHLVLASTRTGAKELFVLDVESGRVRQLTHGGARMPAWSSRLGSTP